MKKIISILLCILMFVSVCPVAVLAADGGDGSSEDLPSSAIAINNVDELVMICNEYPADGYYYLTGDIDLSYALGEYGDYYNGGKGWEPIGNSNTPFEGTFDGRGYTIKGLSINRPEQDYIGLFGDTSGATLKNCKLDIVKIVGRDCVGGFAGHSYNSTFENCETLGGAISANCYVGGIIGYTNGTVTISNCTNNGTVSSSNGGSSYSGGMVGYTGGTATISNCTNNGAVSSSSSSDYSYSGGMVGYTDRTATISNCTNNGTISSSSYAHSSHSYSGGIVGYGKESVTISNCTNNGAVSSSSSFYYSSSDCWYSYSYSGGMVGFVNISVIISGCVNNGRISSCSPTRAHKLYSGGIVGYLQKGTGTINNSINDGTVSSYGTSGSDAGSVRVSVGIAGHCESGAITIKECINLGNAQYALCYAPDSSTSIKNCYNFSSSAFKYNGTAKNCYSISSFTATNGTVWLSDGSAVTRTNKQMRLKSTFEGFDFENTWTMEGNPDFPYPELISNPSSFKKSLASISVAALPDKINYLEGKDEFDITGALLRLTYDNGTTEKIPMTAEMVSGFDNGVIGKQTITVTYMGKTTTFEVEIIAKTAMSVSVTQKPDKLTYLEGKDELDVTGGVITVYYDNDSTSTMVMTPDMITGFDNFKPGTQTLTVTYLGKTATFDVVIKAKTIVAFELVKNPVKTVYKEGEALTLEGIVGRFTYDNGAVVDLPVATAFASGFNNRKVGKQTVTITIDTYVDSFEVTVEHDYRETVVPSTCIKKGYTQYTCTVCGDNCRGNETDFAKHTYNENVIPSTCTKEGYTEFTCSVCGYSYKDNYTDKAPHDTVSHPGKAAKCTEKGYKDYVTCKNCDYTTFEETPVLGHDTETLGAVAATCTKTGLTEGKRCKRCGEILVKQNVIAKVPHKWDGGKVTKQPLVGVAGERTYTCTVCKTTRTETIAPLAPQNIEVKTTDIGKMLADGIVGALPGVTSGALLKTSNASYITDKNGKRLANNIPLATGMRIVLESGSAKLQKSICILGDVDCDGAVTVNDARAALRAAVKLDILKGASLDAARVLGNSTVTVDDARAILRVVVKLDSAKDWLKKVK